MRVRLIPQTTRLGDLETPGHFAGAADAGAAALTSFAISISAPSGPFIGM